jgi:hypothetical protein
MHTLPPLTEREWSRLINERATLRLAQDEASLIRRAALDQMMVEHVCELYQGSWIVTSLMECDALPALRAVADMRGPIALQRLSKPQIGSSLKAGVYGFLVLLHEYGVLNSDIVSLALTTSVVRDDKTMYSFIRNELGVDVPLTRAITSVMLVTSTGPNLASEVALSLRAKRSPGPVGRRDYFNWLATSTHRDIRLKSLAILACLGTWIDPSTDERVQQILLDDLPDEMRFIITGNASAHGALRIAAMEPSVEDVLARPYTSSFFGFDATLLSNCIAKAEAVRSYA